MSSEPEMKRMGRFRFPTISRLYHVSVIRDLIYFTNVNKSWTKSGVDEKVFSTMRPRKREDALFAMYIETEPPRFRPNRYIYSIFIFSAKPWLSMKLMIVSASFLRPDSDGEPAFPEYPRYATANTFTSTSMISVL